MRNAEFQIMTANRLIDGEVVYLAVDRWSLHFADARVIAGEDAVAQAQAEADAAVAARRIVAPYLCAVTLDPGGRPVPASERERIRAAGPTVRRDLGKQAAAGAPREVLHVSL